MQMCNSILWIKIPNSACVCVCVSVSACMWNLRSFASSRDAIAAVTAARTHTKHLVWSRCIRIDQNRFFIIISDLCVCVRSVWWFCIAGLSTKRAINVLEPNTHKSLVLAVNDTDRTFRFVTFFPLCVSYMPSAAVSSSQAWLPLLPLPILILAR